MRDALVMLLALSLILLGVPGVGRGGGEGRNLTITPAPTSTSGPLPPEKLRHIETDFDRTKPIPASCKRMKLPIASAEAAVCAALSHIEKRELGNWSYKYEARETDNGTWVIEIEPDCTNCLGGGWTFEIARKTGAVVRATGSQ